MLVACLTLCSALGMGGLRLICKDPVGFDLYIMYDSSTRKDGTINFTDSVSGLTTNDLLGNSGSLDTKGKRDVQSAYAEFAVPLVSPEMMVIAAAKSRLSADGPTRRAAAERERAERLEAEAQRLRVAEAEARLRVQLEERERATRDREAVLQQELIRIRAERDVLHDKLLEPPPPPPRPPRWTGLASSLALVLSVATLGVAGRYLWRLPQLARAATPIASAPLPPPSPPPPPPSLPQVALGTVSAPRPEPSPSAPRPRPVRSPPRPQPAAPTTLLDDCRDSNDPLCGLSVGGSSSSRPRSGGR